MFINVENDIISKYIKLHFFEITFFRFLFASIVLIPVIFYRDRKVLFSNISIHLTRGIILFLATTSWTYGLSTIHINCRYCNKLFHSINNPSFINYFFTGTNSLAKMIGSNFRFSRNYYYFKSRFR